MWFWITITTLSFILLIIIEESIYYFWNRYVFGPNNARRNKWKSRFTAISTFFKRRSTTELHETNKTKSSQ
ncbi:MAG: hypothetical protein K6T88_11965 [Bacillus sp. (in: Bacteria)]|nr:hypothetical protein [Bacillus sp. (in: firmicutes)]